MDAIWSLDELREHRQSCAAHLRQLMTRVAALRVECAEVRAASDRARDTAASRLAERQLLLDDLRAGLRQHDGTTRSLPDLPPAG